MSLEPKLTRLDERVLAKVPVSRPGVRASALLLALPKQFRHGPPPCSLEELRGILRGFEHLGKVTGRGGWWRAL